MGDYINIIDKSETYLRLARGRRYQAARAWSAFRSFISFYQEQETNLSQLARCERESLQPEPNPTHDTEEYDTNSAYKILHVRRN